MPAEWANFGSYLMLEFGRWDAAKGWTKQLHLGAKRAVNSLALEKLGPDTGFDSIGDWSQIDTLAAAAAIARIKRGKNRLQRK